MHYLTRKSLFYLKFVVLILTFVFITISSKNRLEVSYHVDEIDFLDRSSYYDLFVNRQFTNPAWLEKDAYDQPPLSYYLFGLTLDLFDKNNKSERVWKDIVPCLLDNHIDINHTSDEEIIYILGHYIDDKKPSELPPCMDNLKVLLNRMRIASTTTATLTLLSIFVICWNAGFYWVGLISVLLIYSNPLFASSTYRAMSDGLLLFTCLGSSFINSFILLGIRSYRLKSFFLNLVLFSIFSSLAMSTKLNGGIVVLGGILFAFSCLWIYLKSNKRRIRYSIYIAIVPIIVTTLFIILNPFFYRNTRRGLEKMVEHRIATINFQQKSGGEEALLGIPQRISRIEYRLMGSGGYGNFSFSWMNSLSTVGGLAILARWFIKKRNPFSLFLLWWFLFWHLYLIVFLPLDWDRYYLPIIPWVSVVQAVGIYGLIKLIFERLLFHLKPINRP